MIAIGLHFYHKMQTDCWCARQDLNLHARAMEPKSIVSANSTTGAYTGELQRKRPPGA